jgi:hypothetical protein
MSYPSDELEDVRKCDDGDDDGDTDVVDLEISHFIDPVAGGSVDRRVGR